MISRHGDATHPVTHRQLSKEQRRSCTYENVNTHSNLSFVLTPYQVLFVPSFEG